MFKYVYVVFFFCIFIFYIFTENCLKQFQSAYVNACAPALIFEFLSVIIIIITTENKSNQ